jgi:hypothetical protein
MFFNFISRIFSDEMRGVKMSSIGNGTHHTCGQVCEVTAQFQTINR